jgi:aspartate/methionine/tyrosine aminotransferase
VGGRLPLLFEIGRALGDGMRESDRLNALLEREAPGLARCLSPLGRRAAFPHGIPFQAAQARGAEIDATIGQLTDSTGNPMPLPEIAESLVGLDAREAFLYAPVAGPQALRAAWGARERRLGNAGPQHLSATPIVTHGLTHALSVLADLFSDEDTDILIPAPYWENYELLFQLQRDARIVPFPFFRDGRFNVEGLSDALQRVRHKAVVILNLPGNPSGYAPRLDEVAGIVDALASAPKPTVVAVDDAYQGWVYEPGHLSTSIFWPLLEKADPERIVPIKIDGATKELAFFASRVGFLTASLPSPEAEAALESKIKCIIRGTVGSASGPALAMVNKALKSPALDDSFEARRAELAVRYRALRDAVATIDDPRFTPQPFNAAYFALFQLSGGVQAEELRVRLLKEHGVGAIAFPEANALRLAYCSIGAEVVPELVRRIERALGPQSPKR